MNDKLKRKAQKIIAVLAKCSNKKPEAVHEAVGYILAFEERLPSSEIRIGYIQQHLTETLTIASYLGENTMLQPKEIFRHAAYYYELRNAAAFNSLLFMAKLRREDGLSCSAECSGIVREMVRAFTDGQDSATVAADEI